MEYKCTKYTTNNNKTSIMAIIYSYPTATPTLTDLVLGTDVDKNGNPTKNFTIKSIVDLITGTAAGLGATLTLSNDARIVNADGSFGANQSAINFANITGTGGVTGFASFSTLAGASITGTVGAGFTNITAAGIVQAGTFTDGTMTITGGVGTAFASITTTGITITGTVGGAALLQVITTPVAPATGATDKIVSEKGIIDYIASQPSPENLFKTLQAGNKAYDTTAAGNPGFDIDMGITGTTNGNILFGDNKKIRIGDFGVTYPLELFYGGDPGPATDTVAILQNKAGGISGTVPLTLRSNILDLSSVGSVTPSVAPQKYLTATKYADAASTGVLLYYNDTKKFETTATGIDVTGIMATDNIVNPGYYNGSNGVGTTGQLLSSTVTGTNWIDNPNPVQYTWTISSDSNTPLAVVTGTTIDFAGGDNITTQWAAPAAPATIGTLTIDATGLAKIGTAASNQVTYWSTPDTISGSGTFRWISGSGGATSGLSVDTQIRAAKYTGATVISGVLTNTTATWEGAVMSGFTSVSTVNSVVVGNPNGFFGPLRTNAASTNYAAGVADQAVQLTGTGTITLNAGGSEVSSTTGTYKAGAVIALDVTLNNDAVIGKVLTGLSVPATGNSIEPDDSIVIAFGKLQAQHNTSVNGLRYIGTWDARTQAEGGSAGDEGNPALADGGGVITTGTNTSVVADQLVDTTVGNDFASAGVTAGDRVYNQAGAFTTVSSNAGSVTATILVLNEDIFLTNGQTYSVDDNPALSQGEYYVVNQAGTVDLNGIASWAIGDWVIAGAGNTWEKLDQTGVDGTGSINRIPRWDTVSSLNDSIILQSATGITLDTGKNFATQGAGTITSAAMLTAAVDFTLTGGINLPTGYGGSGQVLTTETAGGGTGTDMVWTTPTTGTLTGVTAGTGITVNPSAAPSPTVNIDYLGTDNAILSATAYSGTVIPGTNQIWFNDENAGANTVSYGLVNQLPFDQYSSWNLSDGTNTAIIASTNTAKILGGAGITSVVSPTDKSATLSIDYVGADNAILSAGAGTPIATDELWFNNADVASGTVQRASIASIVDLGNETLAQVLSNDNVSGANDIVMADSQKVTFGANPDLQIYHSTDSFIQTLTSGSGDFYIGSQVAGKDLKISSSNDITMETAVGGDGIKILGAGAVELYHNGSKKFETTNAGVSVTGSLLVSNGSKGNLFLGPQTGGGATNSEITSNHSLYIDYAKLTGTSGNFNIRNNTTQQFTIQGSTGRVEINEYGSGTITGTPTYNLEVNSLGHIIETPSTNPGGGGGTFHGDQAIITASTSLAFTLTRAATGTLIFDVWLTAETSSAASVAKKYTVAHSFNSTPVYNKIIDTGPDNTNDFTVVFANSNTGAAGTSVTCSIQSVTLATQNIGYTVQVGYDSTRALTFTPAS
jgi:hypothetical protein